MLVILAQLILSAGFSVGHGYQSTQAAPPKFIIVTKGQLGFKEGEDSYSLGMKFAEFRKNFGPPEKSNNIFGTDVYDYTNDGITVNVLDGTITGFIFRITPASHSSVNAANVTTDTNGKHFAGNRVLIRQALPVVFN